MKPAAAKPRTQSSTRVLEVLDTQMFERDQSLWGKRVVSRNGQRFRAEVRRNAYDVQSYGRVEVWSAEGWRLIESRPIEACGDIARHNYVSRGGWQPDMIVALDGLIALGLKIVPEDGA